MEKGNETLASTEQVPPFVFPPLDDRNWSTDDYRIAKSAENAGVGGMALATGALVAHVLHQGAIPTTIAQTMESLSGAAAAVIGAYILGHVGGGIIASVRQQLQSN